MTEFGPKDLPARKSKVHKRSRERIVRTEEAVDAERHAKQRARYEMERQRDRADAWQDAVRGPLESGLLDSLYRQVGAMMADMLMADLEQSGSEALGHFGRDRMYHAARELGDKAASSFIQHALADKMKIDGSATREHHSGEIAVRSSVRFQPTDIHYAHVFDLADRWRK